MVTPSEELSRLLQEKGFLADDPVDKDDGPLEGVVEDDEKVGVLSLVVEEFRQAQDREGVVLEKEVDFLVLGEQLDLFLLVDPIDVDDGQGEEVPPCLQDEGIHQREGGGEGEGKGCPFVLLRIHA